MKEKENKCFEVFCDGKNWSLRNILEKETKDCKVYVACDNKTGLVTRSKCNSSEVCLNNKCLSKDNITMDLISVEVLLDSGVDLNQLDSEEIRRTLQIICKIDSELTVAYEADNQDNVVRVLVYVNDVDTANIIVSSINECAQ